ncbi:TPA: conjugal transfer protein TraL, partial [Escherichia coli]|nr:conjugal transfer protein TraL [Escherichia coli]
MRDDVEERYIFPQTLTEQKRLIGIPLDEATVG